VDGEGKKWASVEMRLRGRLPLCGNMGGTPMPRRGGRQRFDLIEAMGWGGHGQDARATLVGLLAWGLGFSGGGPADF
jgi:hypothetical protein